MRSQHVHHDHSRLYRHGIEAGLLVVALVLLAYAMTQWRPPMAQQTVTSATPPIVRILGFNPGTGTVYDGVAHPIPNFGRAAAADLGFYPSTGSVYDGQPHPIPFFGYQAAADLGFYPSTSSVYDGIAHPVFMPSARLPVVPGLGFNPGTGTVYDGQAHPIPNFGRIAAPDLGFYPGTGTVYDGQPHPNAPSYVVRVLGFDPGTGTVYDGEPHPTNMEDSLAR